MAPRLQFSSVFNIECRVCDNSVTVNDRIIDWSARNQEIRTKWAIDREEKFTFDSSFQIEAKRNFRRTTN